MKDIECIYCKITKSKSEFHSKAMCLLCRQTRNKIASKLARRKLYAKSRDKIIAINKQYYQNNKKQKSEYDKSYWERNKKKRLVQITARHNSRLKEDSAYKMRSIVSTSIGKELKKKGFSKNGLSILSFLPYSIQELKDHLEKQFDSWMSWENYGTYRVVIWDDNDSATWTWQLDHIIPHSKFNYTSLIDTAFRDCWALSNLRPLSAKRNVIEGNRS